MTGIPDDAILDNLLEAYDISNDFRKHEHEMVIQTKFIQQFLLSTIKSNICLFSMLSRTHMIGIPDNAGQDPWSG